MDARGRCSCCRACSQPTISRSAARVIATYSRRRYSCSVSSSVALRARARKAGPPPCARPRPRLAAISPRHMKRRRRCVSDGDVVVSAMIHDGASSPLAPCTVITRTSSREISMSRFTSVSAARSQAMNPCSEPAPSFRRTAPVRGIRRAHRWPRARAGAGCRAAAVAAERQAKNANGVSVRDRCSHCASRSSASRNLSFPAACAASARAANPSDSTPA